MHRRTTLTLVLAAAGGLLLAGCGGGDQDATSPNGQSATQSPDTEGADPGQDDLMGGDQSLGDPNDDVEDGVYSGQGVTLPVPQGWTIDPTAVQQGMVAAFSDDGTQQLMARAIDLEDAAPGQDPPDFDSLLDSVRQQVPQQPDIDEEVELTGADRAHRLTFLDLPPQQEGAPASSVTVVLAEDGEGMFGEFAFTSTTDAYDEATAELLLAQAGFDPDSDPPAAPPPGPGGTAPPHES